MKYPAIDIVVNLFGPDDVAGGQTGFDANFMEQVRMPEALRKGITMQDCIKKMDAANIERSLLIAVRAGEVGNRGSFEIPYADVAAQAEGFPDRLAGLAGVDPYRGMQGLRDLEYAVRELGSSEHTATRTGSSLHLMQLFTIPTTQNAASLASQS